MRTHRVVPLLLLGLGCRGPGADVGTPAAADLAAYVQGLADRGLFTGAMRVERRGRVLLRGAHGMADASLGAPNRPETRFRIGSNTKQFVAWAMWRLQATGRLRLTDRVCRWLARCPAAWSEVTLQQLLNHTSGIPDFMTLPDFPARIGDAATEAELLARVADRPLEFAPGSRWSYSNTGYVALGAVVAAADGRRWSDFLQDGLWRPLGMLATAEDVDRPAVPEHATGYLAPGVKPVFLAMSEFDAAGDVVSTVDDLARWDEALLSGEALPAADRDEMLRPKIVCPTGGCASATDVGYADGWFVGTLDGRRCVYHWGRIDGFRSSNVLLPDDGVVVVVLSNLETVDVFGLGAELARRARTAP